MAFYGHFRRIPNKDGHCNDSKQDSKPLKKIERHKYHGWNNFIQETLKCSERRLQTWRILPMQNQLEQSARVSLDWKNNGKREKTLRKWRKLCNKMYNNYITKLLSSIIIEHDK